jgi:nucleotide-binding universal stress UspA family protein
VFKTVLVALDGSELSDRVIQTLLELNLKPDAKVILAHVISPVDSGMETPANLPAADSEIELYRHTEQQLLAYQADLPCPSQLEIVTGDPADEIIRLANIYQAKLIVIGSRGLTGVNRILQGSVSSQVVTDAHCSVLVVKP